MRQPNKHIRPGSSYLNAVAANAARPFHFRTGLTRLLAGRLGAAIPVGAKHYYFPPHLHYLHPAYRRAFAGAGPAASTPDSMPPDALAATGAAPPAAPLQISPARAGTTNGRAPPRSAHTAAVPGITRESTPRPASKHATRTGEHADTVPPAPPRPEIADAAEPTAREPLPGIKAETAGRASGPQPSRLTGHSDTPAPAGRATPRPTAKPAGPEPAARIAPKAGPDTGPPLARPTPPARFPKGENVRPNELHPHRTPASHRPAGPGPAARIAPKAGPPKGENGQPNELHPHRAPASHRPAAREPARHGTQTGRDTAGRPSSTQTLLDQLGRFLERENFQPDGPHENRPVATSPERPQAGPDTAGAATQGLLNRPGRFSVRENSQADSPRVQRRGAPASGTGTPATPRAVAQPARAPVVLPYRQSAATPDRAPATDPPEASDQTAMPAETFNPAPPARRRSRRRPSGPAPAAFWERSYLGRLHIRTYR